MTLTLLLFLVRILAFTLPSSFARAVSLPTPYSAASDFSSKKAVKPLSPMLAFRYVPSLELNWVLSTQIRAVRPASRLLLQMFLTLPPTALPSTKLLQYSHRFSSSDCTLTVAFLLVRVARFFPFSFRFTSLLILMMFREMPSGAAPSLTLEAASTSPRGSYLPPVWA